MRSWLEQDTSCPTCRKTLQDENQQQQTNANSAQDANQQRPQQQIYQFNGSRYFRWLPNFSLQIMNAGGGGRGRGGAAAQIVLPNLLQRTLNQDQLNEMTQHISQIFPHISFDLIINDLRRTQSIEHTIENIVEDRINNNTNVTNNNHNNNRNLLNVVDYSTDEDDEMDDEEIEEEEEEMNENLNLDNANQNVQNGVGVNLLRQRNTLFSQFLNTIQSANQEQEQQQQDVYQIRQQDNAQNSSDETNSNNNSNAGLISRYNTSPLLAESTNDLIQRKRELILNSRK